jgi:hypothetical protein
LVYNGLGFRRIAEQGNGSRHAQARDHLFGFPEGCKKIPKALSKIFSMLVYGAQFLF